MRSKFDSWLIENYGYEANGLPIRDEPPSFGSEDRVFDITGYERWVERMKKRYDATTVDLVRLSDGSWGAPGSVPPGPTNLLPAPTEPTIGSPVTTELPEGYTEEGHTGGGPD